jgi:predicted TIM-barrel fold metal-dependent hydrolase
MRGQKAVRAALISPRHARWSAIVISPAEFVAIDVHTHAEVSAREPMDEVYERRSKAMAEYFKAATHRSTVPEVAAYYRARKIACVIFPVDRESASGERRVSNEEVAELAAQNSDIMIPFASIDPAKGRVRRAGSFAILA